MTLKIWDRQVNSEVAYIRIGADTSVTSLILALNEFGAEDSRWSVEGNHLVLTRELSSTEMPSSGPVSAQKADSDCENCGGDEWHHSADCFSGKGPVEEYFETLKKLDPSESMAKIIERARRDISNGL